MVKGAEGCSRTGIFNGKPDCKKYLEKAGLTEYFQIIIGGDQSCTASRMENLSEGVCCAWNRSVTDVWRGGFL